MKKFKITIIGTIIIFTLYIFYLSNVINFEIYNLFSYGILLVIIFMVFSTEGRRKIK
ncbi:MAG: hypothetical protein ACRCYE_00340 [Sarcina sp.]